MRVRSKFASHASPWVVVSGTPAPQVLALTPDPDRLTGLTFNDGVRDLPLEATTANAVGFGGPGTYVVHAPPGVDSLTVTPTWTSSDVIGVNSWARDISRGGGNWNTPDPLLGPQRQRHGQGGGPQDGRRHGPAHAHCPWG